MLSFYGGKLKGNYCCGTCQGDSSFTRVLAEVFMVLKSAGNMQEIFVVVVPGSNLRTLSNPCIHTRSFEDSILLS